MVAHTSDLDVAPATHTCSAIVRRSRIYVIKISSNFLNSMTETPAILKTEKSLSQIKDCSAAHVSESGMS